MRTEQVLLFQVRGNGNKGVLHTSQISTTGASPSEASLVSYQDNQFLGWGGLTSLQSIQSTYSKPCQLGQHNKKSRENMNLENEWKIFNKHTFHCYGRQETIFSPHSKL